jgi:hypothetical protein
MKKTICLMAWAACSLGLNGLAGAADAKAGDAPGSCESKAIDKNGKPLAGAAKASFMKKCEADSKPSCESKAIDKNGKPLAGAAKASFMKKCEADARAPH